MNVFYAVIQQKLYLHLNMCNTYTVVGFLNSYRLKQAHLE